MERFSDPWACLLPRCAGLVPLHERLNVDEHKTDVQPDRRRREIVLTILKSRSSLFQTSTVTRRNVAGMNVASLLGLLFWLLNRASNSFCK